MNVWWWLALLAVVWALGLLSACRAYLLGYERARRDLLGDFF